MILKYANALSVASYDQIEKSASKTGADKHTLSVFGSKSLFQRKYAGHFDSYRESQIHLGAHSVSEYDPEFKYYRVIALHGDIPNDNGDMFQWGNATDKNAPELLRYDSDTDRYVYESFIGRGNFVNHKNDDVLASVGIVLDAIPNHEGKFIECLLAVDAKKDANLVRSIEKGYTNAVSMGCAVGYSLCSICGNKATAPHEYCDHIKFHKAQTIDGKRVYEDNRRVNFIELSWVTVPADPSARLLEKVAHSIKTKEDETIQNVVTAMVYTFGEEKTRYFLSKIQEL